MKHDKYLKGTPYRHPGSKPATTIIYDPETEAILKQLETPAPEIDRQAHQDGADGRPGADQRTFCNTELEIQTKFEGFLREAMMRIALVITNVQVKLDNQSRLNELLTTDPEGALKELGLQHQSSLIRQLQALKDEADGKEKILQRKKENLLREFEKDKVERNIVESALGYRPRKRPLWSRILYPLLFLLAGLTDVSVTFKNLESTAKTSPVASLVIALAIAFALAADAHYLGRSIRTNNRKDRNLCLIATPPFMILVGILAFGYGNFITALINVAIFFVLTVIAYFHTPEKADLVEKYFRDDAAIDAGDVKIVQIEKEIHSIGTKTRAVMLQLIQTYQSEAIAEYNTLTEKLAEWQEYRDRVKDRFTTYYHRQIHRYRTVNQSERAEKGHPPVKWWMEENEIPPLRERDDSKDGFAKDAGIKAIVPENNGKVLNYGVNLMPLILLGTLMFGNCQLLTSDDRVDVEIRTLSDHSDSMTFIPEIVAAFALKEANFDSTTKYSGVITFKVSALNDRYSNQTYTAQLPESGSVFSEITSERLARQGFFYREVITKLKEGYHFTGELPHSRLYRPICDALQDLHNSKAERKMCFLFSDGLENTKEVSFYEYQRNPVQLLKEKDKVIAMLEAQGHLPDLTGIEIYIIYDPSQEMDELVYYTKQFWQDYFQSQGATVHLLAGVNGSLATKYAQ